MDILDVAKKLNTGKHHSVQNDDVFIDRLNHKYTVTMILVFAFIVTAQQYIMSPIKCWTRDTSSISDVILLCRFICKFNTIYFDDKSSTDFDNNRSSQRCVEILLDSIFFYY
ncbi:unnamed protein product [Rotaria sp. Silwood1]|nr:unnamed protein product [Rotaria sp. Silwood1]